MDKINTAGKSFCQLKGISATGKGTRVSQLLLFLNYKSQDGAKIVYVDDRPYGIYVEKFNLLVPGKYVVSNKSGLISLTGLDIMVSDMDDGRFMPDELMKLYPEASIICEGYVSTQGTYYQPQNQYNNGFKNQQWEVYLYDNLEELQKRVIGRSASRIKGTCWVGNEVFKSHFTHDILPQCASLEEKDEDFHSFTLFSKFSESHAEFGKRWLTFNGHRDLVDEFVTWSNENSVLRIVTQSQDLSIFPMHLLEGRSKKLRSNQDTTQAKVSSIEELARIEGNHHKGEPFTQQTLLLSELDAFLEIHTNFVNYEEHRREYNASHTEDTIELPRLYVLKNRLSGFLTDFGKLYVELSGKTEHTLKLIEESDNV